MRTALFGHRAAQQLAESEALAGIDPAPLGATEMVGARFAGQPEFLHRSLQVDDHLLAVVEFKIQHRAIAPGVEVGRVGRVFHRAHRLFGEVQVLRLRQVVHGPTDTLK